MYFSSVALYPPPEVGGFTATEDNHKQSQFPLRLPEDLKAWLKNQAEINFRSINAEINYQLANAKILATSQKEKENA